MPIGVEEPAVVGDGDDRARAGGERGLEHLERVEVEVVGRLVEQQEVGVGGDDGRDRRAGALAGAEALERAPHRAGIEAEVGEQRARLGLVDARACVAAEPGQQRAGGFEGLREQPHRRRGRHRPFARCQRAEQELQQRRLAGAVGARDGDALAAVQREVDVLEHAGAHAVEVRDAAAAVGGGVELEAHGRRGPRPLDPGLRAHRALEPALARLRLLRDLLGVAPLLVGAEAGGAALAAAGEVAGVGDVGLEPPAALVLRGGELLEARAPAGLLLAVGRVAAVVGGQAVAELVDARDDGVEEAAVVGDDEDGAVEAVQELLQPGQAGRVEVVGRLVEQQDVGVLEERGRQQAAGLLAAGEPMERAVGGEVVDPQAAAHLLGARLGGPRSGGLGTLEGVGVGVEVAGLPERGERPARLAEGVVEERRRAWRRAPPAAGSRRRRPW